MPTLRTRITRVLVATAATAFAFGCPAVAVADTQLITTCPQPTETGGVIVADTVTECSTPGNIQLNASPEMPDYPYPWDDEFYGPALLIGGFGRGYR
jgi:hypothetical protein